MTPADDQMEADRAAVLRGYPRAVCEATRLMPLGNRTFAIIGDREEWPRTVTLSGNCDTEAAAWADAARRLTQGEG